MYTNSKLSHMLLCEGLLTTDLILFIRLIEIEV